MSSFNGFQADFDSLAADPAGRGPDWLRELRRRAFDRFHALGVPSTRSEAWRYTSLAPLAKARFTPAAKQGPGRPVDKELDGYSLWDSLAIQMVFVDGRFSPEHSQMTALPNGVKVLSLSRVLQEEPERLPAEFGQQAHWEEQPFVALNTALFREGAWVEIAPGAVVEHPIHLLYLSTKRETPFVAHPRLHIRAGDSSQATVVETFAGPEGGSYFNNVVSEVRVGANASLHHYRDQEESLEAFHLGFLAAVLERDSRFHSNVLAFGGALARNEISLRFGGEGGECALDGLYVADGSRHLDNQTLVDHAVPRCTSRESYRGVLDDRARGVFNGRVIVRPDAQKSEAHQQNKNLLLSRTAAVDTKPQLEIYADDVVCTHGATIGQLDESSIFYLRSRGIGDRAARSILTRAFAGAVTERVTVAPLRCRIDQLLYHRLEEQGAGASLGALPAEASLA